MIIGDETRTNGHHAEPATRAWDARFVAIERRLVEVAETAEQRILVLRDALADFCAGELQRRDDEIAILKKYIADLERRLEQKAEVDAQVHEVATRLEEMAARRDEAKRGPPGPPGESITGPRGFRGKNGITKILKQTVTIKNWRIDTEMFTVAAELSDGSSMPVLNLRPLFENYDNQVAARGS